MAGAGDMVMRGSFKTCQAAVGQFGVYLICCPDWWGDGLRDVAGSSCKWEKARDPVEEMEKFSFMSWAGASAMRCDEGCIMPARSLDLASSTVRDFFEILCIASTFIHTCHRIPMGKWPLGN
jgi:hypothetical protein